MPASNRRSRIAAALALAFVPWSHALAQAGEHVESGSHWPNAPITDSSMTARLQHAANQYREYAPIPRLAQYDLGYPRDSAEYSRLHGYAILLVTAVTQDSSELPLTHVYFRPTSGPDVELHRLGQSCGTVQTGSVSTVFGKYRCDALYLSPAFLPTLEGDLLIDFAANRQAFRLNHYSGDIPPRIADLPLAAPGPTPPAPQLKTFVQREFPALAALIQQ